MRHFVLTALLVLASPVRGDEGVWVPMNGAEITQALSDRSLRYTTATQKFYASGKTLYDSGRPSWGNWRVDNDQYCSQWPPNDLWACYKMERRGDSLRFVGERDDITEGVYIDAD